MYFHIVTQADGTGAVSDATVAAQIVGAQPDVLAGWYGGDDTGFDFRLVGDTSTANDAWFEGERESRTSSR